MDTFIRATSTRAKSRDHEIMRAQKKVFKGRPNTPSESCYFNGFIFMWVFTHDKIEYTNSCEQ